VLDRSHRSGADRAFVTELVYGATRMRRSCDWLVDRFVLRPLDKTVRAALRLGAYQLAFLRTPAHAAVAETVAVVPGRVRGLVNAVLRQVASAGPPVWPDEGTRLSYPDWIIERLRADLGDEAALGALEQMNVAPSVTRRPDGVVQDRASQWVAELVGARSGERIVDVCAGPGGKTTAMADADPLLVIGADVRAARAALVRTMADSVRLANVSVVVADGRCPPFATATADRVLVDAPCSGLGVLRRRADARWRVTPDAVDDLARLQKELLDGAALLVRPGGRLAYSVCTLTMAETVAIDEWMADRHPEFRPVTGPSEPWQPHGRGALLLPQRAGTDGMFIAIYERGS
jgi:16S rRNA (cytosine967-C5)-methyltransferase